MIAVARKSRSRGANFSHTFFRKVVCLYTLALLYLSSGSLELFKEGGARPQDATYYASASGGAFDGVLILWFITSIPLTLLALGRSKRLLVRALDARFLALFLLAATSLAWSLDRYAAVRNILLMVQCYLLVTAYVYLYEGMPRRLVQHLISAIFVIQLLSLGFSLFLPSYGISVGNEAGAWQGVFSHKNNLGNFCAMSFCLCLGFFSITRGPVLYVTLALSVYLTWMSESSTSMAVVAASLVLFACLKSRGFSRLIVRNRRTYLFLLLCLSFGVVAFAIFGSAIPVLGKDTTFSNRNAIWGFLSYRILDRPFLGHGVNQFVAHFVKADATFYDTVGFVVSHAHNGFLDILYSLGVAGFILMLVILARVLPDSSESLLTRLSFTFVLATVLVNTFEVRLFNFSFGFFGICLIYNIKRSRIGDEIYHRALPDGSARGRASPGVV